MGDNEATRKLINVYSNGVTVTRFSDQFELEKDPVIAKAYEEVYFEQLKTNSEHDYEAAFWLARVYEKGGMGLDVSIKQAQLYYEKSAQILEEQVKNGDMDRRVLYAKLKGSNQHPSIIKNPSVALDILETLVKDGNRESYVMLGRVYLQKQPQELYDTVKIKYKFTDVQAEAKGLELLTYAGKKGDAEAQRRLIYYYKNKLKEDKDGAERLVYWTHQAMPQTINNETLYSILFNAKLEVLASKKDGKALVEAILQYYSREKFENLNTVNNTSLNITDAMLPVKKDESFQVGIIRTFINSSSKEEKTEISKLLAKKLVTITKHIISKSDTSICDKNHPEVYLVADTTSTLMSLFEMDKDFNERLKSSIDTCEF